METISYLLLAVGIILLVYGISLNSMVVVSKLYGKTVEGTIVSSRTLHGESLFPHRFTVEYTLRDAHYYAEIRTFFLHGKPTIGRVLPIGVKEGEDGAVLREGRSLLPFWSIGTLCVIAGSVLLVFSLIKENFI